MPVTTENRVIIRIWTSAQNKLIPPILLPGAGLPVGHISLETPDQRYVSLWPQDAASAREAILSSVPSHLHTFEEDCEDEGRVPEVVICLYTLDIEAIQNTFREIATNLNGWTLLGGNQLFSKDDQAHSCSSLAYRLLKAGHIDAILESGKERNERSSVMNASRNVMQKVRDCQSDLVNAISVSPDSLLTVVVAAKIIEMTNAPETASENFAFPTETSLSIIKNLFSGKRPRRVGLAEAGGKIRLGANAATSSKKQTLPEPAQESSNIIIQEKPLQKAAPIAQPDNQHGKPSLLDPYSGKALSKLNQLSDIFDIINRAGDDKDAVTLTIRYSKLSKTQMQQLQPLLNSAVDLADYIEQSMQIRSDKRAITAIGFYSKEAAQTLAEEVYSKLSQENNQLDVSSLFTNTPTSIQSDFFASSSYFIKGSRATSRAETFLRAENFLEAETQLIFARKMLINAAKNGPVEQRNAIEIELDSLATLEKQLSDIQNKEKVKFELVKFEI
ncbi:MAG: hypothetical protein K2Q14_01910 [Gammaproteobacteria bacterium]|nr:hypothetical protein [Gammaproteobacteria bacterium]